MFFCVESDGRVSGLLINMLGRDSFATEFERGNGFLRCCDDKKTSALGAAKIILSPTNPLSLCEAEQIPPDSVVFGGYQQDEVSDVLFSRKISYFNLFKNPIFAIKNAALLAECALSVVLGASDKSLAKTNILILGCGRVARALSMLLLRLGVEPSLATFSESEYETSARFASTCFLGSDFLTHIADFDVVVNTIPKQFLSKNDAAQINPDSTLIELTATGCLQDKNCVFGGFSFFDVPNLAGTLSPVTYSEIMLECIHQQIAAM